MAMRVTYTNFCGQIVRENRNGIESFYVPDTNGATAVLMGVFGNVMDSYGQFPHSESPLSSDGLNFAWPNLGQLPQTLMRWDEGNDLGEI